MHFKTTVTKEIILEVSENLYDDAAIEQVRMYWGLSGYDREEVLEFVAKHIGQQYTRGLEIGEIEGILSDESAHEIIQCEQRTEVESIVIKNS